MIKRLKTTNKFNDFNFPENFEYTDTEFANLVEGYDIQVKDTNVGDILHIKEIINVDENSFEVLTDLNLNLNLNFKKENKFLKLFFNLDTDEEYEYIKNKEILNKLIDSPIIIVNNSETRNIQYSNNGSLQQAYVLNKRDEFYKEIKAEKNKIYNAKVIQLNAGGYLVNIDGLEAFLPGSLASANKIVDFSTFLNKEIPVMIEDYLKEGDTFIVSYKKYLETILRENINSLEKNVEYTGKVTGTTKFGIFVEFNEIFTALLHVSEMNSNTFNTFKRGDYLPDTEINFYVKEVQENKRIILTQNLQVNNIWNIIKENEGNFIEGKIINIVDFGLFVNIEFLRNVFSALCHRNNIFKNINEFNINDVFDFEITSVDIDRKRIILSLK